MRPSITSLRLGFAHAGCGAEPHAATRSPVRNVMLVQA